MREEAALATPAKRLTNKMMKVFISKLSPLSLQSTYTCACKNLEVFQEVKTLETGINMPELTFLL